MPSKGSLLLRNSQDSRTSFQQLLHLDYHFPSSSCLQVSLPTSCLFQMHPSSYSLQKSIGLPETSTKLFARKLGTFLHIKAGWGIPVGGKWFQNQTKKSETPQLSLLGVQQNPKLNKHHIFAKDLQICEGTMITTSVSVSPYEPCLVDSVDHVLLVSLAPLAPIYFFSPSLWGSQSFKWP